MTMAQDGGKVFSLTHHHFCPQEILLVLISVTEEEYVKNQPHYRPEVPRGFQEVKVPRLHNNGPGWW